ncbi:hypothetical protein QP705_07925 [Limosilactobacillus reuteri]|uniref:hypothetical protein n=1 Tax=Limosilactobacillus reuteri TaxID=1598 RepID=UPI00254D5289|nr:hypothetical protein [Limosilactobacillus reuteri]MDK8117124.1 hypothetical protein [Limosilactobacillus reuteri]
MKTYTLQDFIDGITQEVIKEIMSDKKKTYKEARKAFLSSKTYQLLRLHGEDYYHEDPFFFYDLWNNEQKVGEPVTSEELEFTKKGQDLLKRNLTIKTYHTAYCYSQYSISQFLFSSILKINGLSNINKLLYKNI